MNNYRERISKCKKISDGYWGNEKQWNSIDELFSVANELLSDLEQAENEKKKLEEQIAQYQTTLTKWRGKYAKLQSGVDRAVERVGKLVYDNFSSEEFPEMYKCLEIVKRIIQ